MTSIKARRGLVWRSGMRYRFVSVGVGVGIGYSLTARWDGALLGRRLFNHLDFVFFADPVCLPVVKVRLAARTADRCDQPAAAPTLQDQRVRCLTAATRT